MAKKESAPTTPKEKSVARNKARQRAYVRLANEYEDRFGEILGEEAKKLGLKPRVVWS